MVSLSVEPAATAPAVTATVTSTETEPMDAPSRKEVLRAEKRAEAEARLRQEREARRAAQRAMQRARLTLNIDTAVNFSRVFRIYATLGLGFRRNINDSFGIRIRAGGGFGKLRPSVFTDVDDPLEHAALMGAVWGDIAPMLGPFGRFSFGPEVWMTYVFTEDQVAETYDDGSVFRLRSGVLGGVGIAMNALYGDELTGGLNWGIRYIMGDSALGSKQAQGGVMVYLGTTFHFVVEK